MIQNYLSSLWLLQICHEKNYFGMKKNNWNSYIIQQFIVSEFSLLLFLNCHKSRCYDANLMRKTTYWYSVKSLFLPNFDLTIYRDSTKPKYLILSGFFLRIRHTWLRSFLSGMNFLQCTCGLILGVWNCLVFSAIRMYDAVCLKQYCF